uniref:Homeobox domain-containing protein n=1 Tax=Sphaeramia orbicularis TaxID=375764 RepID=A0A672YSH4_9TELE
MIKCLLQECDVALMPGSLYCVHGQSLYCQSHYHGNGSAPLSHDAQPRPNLKEVQNEGEESVSSPEPRLDEGVAAGARVRRRTKRIRTCFRSEQLRALESYFAQKHNPDGKDWTCLAHKTGLPKRVLQVWFQNARAKLRRSLSADDSQVGSPSSTPRAVTVATSTPSPAHSPADQSQPFPGSTIDHLQLSLLTAPLSPPAAAQSQQLHKPTFYLDYDSHNAPGRSPSLDDVYRDLGEGAEAEVNPDSLFRRMF